MIIFKKIRFKNFLSTGENAIEVQLNKSVTTLIVGTNGVGKSQLLDALSFSLFGKPHRNINKPQLVNSINGKNCLVTVEFSIGAHEFKVVRGIKPNIFEIWQNGIMLNQESTNKDYQKYLELNILKLNHKSFHQIVVLGSSSFIPFMQLPHGQRREIIEDLLDINSFSKMNALLKDMMSVAKEENTSVSYQLEVIKEKVDIQRKYIREVTEINAGVKGEKEADIVNTELEIEALQAKNSEISEEIGDTLSFLEAEKKSLVNDQVEALSHKKGFSDKIKQLVKETKFYEANDDCPTCSQPIDEELKRSKVELAKKDAKLIASEMSEYESKLTAIDTLLDAINTQISDIQKKQNTIHENNRVITSLQNRIHAVKKDIARLEDKGSDLSEANTYMDELLASKDDLTEKKLELADRILYYEICSTMLKDTGIKTKIIKSYLPVMNKLINQYLQVLDFFVEFNLDESFNETIRSRYRDNFAYSSFSEGEKSRIDLALLFTWRRIARMKNSVATNLCIMDEVLDASLDQDGIDNLLQIIGTLEDDTNTFVISHKGEVLDGKFEAKIEFAKEKNFTVMKNEK